MRSLLLTSLWLLSFSSFAEVRIAVASNFQAPMKEIIKHLSLQTDSQLLTSYGASGKFYAQIRQGAPFDVFLSADQIKPTELERDGFMVEGSRFTYAIGALALWSRDPERVDVAGTILQGRSFNKLALANPRHAPYGVAAVATLERLNLDLSTKERWVVGENIAQTFQFVSSGNADIGFIARSQLHHPLAQGGSTWLVPQNLHPPIRQEGGLLARGQNNQAAHWFLAALKTAEIQNIIESFGYTTFADSPLSEGVHGDL